MGNRRGSIALMVVVWMSLLCMLAIALCSLVSTGFVMSGYGINSTKAYYAAESGVERSASIIKEEMRRNIDVIRRDALSKYNEGKLSMDGNAGITSYINSTASTYLFNFIYGSGPGSFKSFIDRYQGEKGSDAKSGNYYNVNVTIDYSFANEPSMKAVKIVSRGCSRGGARTISAWYAISYPSVPDIVGKSENYAIKLLSRALTISGGLELYLTRNIDITGDVYIKSPHVIFKNTDMNVNGETVIKAKTLEFGGSIDLKGSTSFDYDNIIPGDGIYLNGLKTIIPADMVVSGFEVYPLGNLDTSSRCGVTYMVFDDDAVVDGSMFDGNPGGVFAIISKKDLKLTDKYGNGLQFNGIIYCSGNLRIDAKKLHVNGSIVCGSCSLNNNMSINNIGAMNEEQMDEIAGKINGSVQNGSVYVVGEYDFKCKNWQE